MLRPFTGRNSVSSENERKSSECKMRLERLQGLIHPEHGGTCGKKAACSKDHGGSCVKTEVKDKSSCGGVH